MDVCWGLNFDGMEKTYGAVTVVAIVRSFFIGWNRRIVFFAFLPLPHDPIQLIQNGKQQPETTTTRRQKGINK